MTINCPNCGNEFDPVGKYGVRRFCSRSCANKRTHTEETRRKISTSAKNKTVSEEVRQQRSLALKERWESGWTPKFNRSPCSDETRQKLRESRLGKHLSTSTKQKLSALAKKREFGGHTSKRKIWYQRPDMSVVFLQSSYEVKLAKLLDDLSIVWTRPAPLDWTDTGGGTHRYYPDFKVGNTYIDTKNDYLIQKDADKIRAVEEQNGIKIHVLSLDMITEEYIASLV